MKKKAVGILLALALSVGVTACTDASDVTKESSKESTESAESSSGEQIGGGDETEPSKEQGGDVVSPDPVEAKEEAVLYNGYYSHVYYGIDSNGNKVSEYRWDDIVEKLKSKGLDYSAGYVSAVEDGLMVFYVYDNLVDHWGYRVCVVDAKTADVKELWLSPTNCWLDNIDVYQGKVYVTISKEDNSREEIVFAKDENGFQFHEESSSYAQLIQKLTGYNLTVRSTKQDSQYGNCSVTRALEENGFVIGYKDQKYYRFDADGSVSEIAGMPSDYYYLESYDRDGIVFSESDYYAGTYVIRALDLKTGTLKTVTEDNGSSILDYEDGKIYYKEQVGDGFVMIQNRVSVYDVATGEKKALYEADAIPGATELDPGTYDFQVVDGKIYYVTLIGDKVEWVKFDPQSENTRETGYVVGEKSAYRYGSIIYDTYIDYCDFCGIPLEKDYQEAFQLKSSYSAHADKINEALKTDLNWVEMDRGDSVETSDAECENHKEMPTIWCESMENEIYGVRIFNDRYLAVDYQGYWYGGGVHGMPSIDQRLFDLETGEEKTLKDFYGGTNEEFAKLAAEKTKEDFLSYEQGASPYFAEDAQKVYEDAYQYLYMGAGQIFFQEDGVNLVYPPYDMGPYASGFIEVFISYEELLGRDGL